MSETVTVTERAAIRISEIAAGEPKTPMLRVSVEGGGCSGFQYKFDLVADRAATIWCWKKPARLSSSILCPCNTWRARKSISSMT